MSDLRIKDLPCHLTWLPENCLAILGVCVIAEVGSFIDKAEPQRVDNDAEGVAVALVGGCALDVAEVCGVGFPGRRMAARPMTVGLSTRLECHCKSVARVVSGPANSSE